FPVIMSYSNWIKVAIEKEYITSYDFSSFDKLEFIGGGGYGIVFRAIREHETVALKCLHNGFAYDIQNYDDEFIREVKNLTKVNNHDNITRFLGITKDYANKRCYMVLQFASKGNLRDYLHDHFAELDWSAKIKMAKEITSTLNKTNDTITASYILPLVSTVNNLVREICNFYESAECNKDICLIMTERVKIAEFAMDKMMRRDECPFYEKEYYLSFRKYINALTEIKNFTEKVSKLEGLRKFFDVSEIKNKYEKLTQNYDTCMNELHFTIAITNKYDRKMENQK
ncbi:21313_t:CDS:2, partial [Gigaspora margarita]